MSGLVVIVDFELEPGSATTFVNLVRENASASVRNEVGCLRFDVLQPNGEPDRVVLYEHYVDEYAFSAHLRTAHFLAFDRAGGPLIVSESVRRLSVVSINPDERAR